MADINIKEAADSRDGDLGDRNSLNRRYHAQGSADGDEIRSAVWDQAPYYHGGRVKKTVSAEPQFVDEDRPEKCIWQATVRYGRRRSEPETGESSMTFNMSSETKHITQSRETVAAYGNSQGPAPWMGGAIGATKDSVEGVDIKIPSFSWTETHYLDDSHVTMAYINTLFALLASVNDKYFRQFAPGEVLLDGVSGASRDDSQEGDWEVQFTFAAQPNRSDIYIGNIGPISKRGWEYLWVFYQKQEGDANLALPRPRAVYVERVYPWGDYMRLGIPAPLD